MTVSIKPWPLGFYAPGNYACKCTTCGKEFEGDKRAVNCLECEVVNLKHAALAHDEQASVPDAGLVEFAKEMIRISFDGGDAEGSDIHATALRHGLLAQIEFDPEIHNDPNGDAEAGDPWFVFAGPLAASPRSAS